MRYQLFVIVNVDNTDQYWSSNNGWVDYLHCDTFTNDDRKLYKLPVSGEWEEFIMVND